MLLTRRDFIKQSALGTGGVLLPLSTIEIKSKISLASYLATVQLPPYRNISSAGKVLLERQDWNLEVHMEWVSFLKKIYDIPRKNILEYGKLVEGKKSIYDTLTYERPNIISVLKQFQEKGIVQANLDGKNITFPSPGNSVRAYLEAKPYFTHKGLYGTFVREIIKP